MTEWINVKDQSGPEYNWVLVCNSKQSDTPICIARWQPTYKKWQFFDTSLETCAGPYCGDSFSFLSTDDITHWMELPETPTS